MTTDQDARHDLDSAEPIVAALQLVAQAPRLLVALDYDGTLAPIVLDPEAAIPETGAIAAVRELAALPRTFVALLSGRSRADLMRLTGLGERTDSSCPQLVGSHGAEHGPALGPSVPLARQARIVTDAARAVVRDVPGAFVEPKPYGVAVHVRGASDADAERVIADVLEGPATLPGTRVLHGKSVVELSVVDADKGESVRRLAREWGADAAVVVGDDETDEWMFAAVSGDDVSVKVGPGETGARFRVAHPSDAVALVRALRLLREEHLASAHAEGRAGDTLRA